MGDPISLYLGKRGVHVGGRHVQTRLLSKTVGVFEWRISSVELLNKRIQIMDLTELGIAEAVSWLGNLKGVLQISAGKLKPIYNPCQA